MLVCPSCGRNSSSQRLARSARTAVSRSPPGWTSRKSSSPRSETQLSAPFHKYGNVPRASKRRSCKARDRGVLGGYGEEAERRRGGCSGDRMRAYLWNGALSVTLVAICTCALFQWLEGSSRLSKIPKRLTSKVRTKFFDNPRLPDSIVSA